MAITQKSRWDDVGSEPPAGEAKYVAGEQPIAEYDNWFNKAVADDIASLNAWLDNLGITKVYFDSEANMPASGETTELFIATDTNKIYRGTGTGWQLLTTEWDAILNKPSTFPPSAHTHVISEITDIDNAKTRTLSKGFTTAETVTETSLTLKQSVTPDNDFISLIDSIHVIATNPSGSGCTLYFMLRALLSDGTTEVDLLDAEESIAEGGSFDDVLIDVMSVIPSNEKIKAVRLYAYCSATPATGYEPSVQLEKVTGVQN